MTRGGAPPFMPPPNHLGVPGQGVVDGDEEGFEGAFVAIRAPEGTTLFAFEEDFLGESYEVEESGYFSALPD